MRYADCSPSSSNNNNLLYQKSLQRPDPVETSKSPSSSSSKGNEKGGNSHLSEHTLEEQKMMAEVAKLNSLSIRCQKFKALLEQPNVDFGKKDHCI